MRWRTLGILILPMLATATVSRGNAAAADDLTVLAAEDAPRTMLYRALEGQARERLEARRKEVAALKTPEQIEARRTRLKGQFLDALGPLPERTPLNAKVVGRDRRDGYSVERVIYESRPRHFVTAALYLPDGPPRFPGVLVPCGHSVNGKAAEPYQRISILLAKNGMAALCYDPFGQGERIQALDGEGKPLVAGSTSEHTMAGIGALLVGQSAATYAIWDGIRSLDYLASRAEIDPDRLGCTGNSGGGTLTAYLMALDDRIAVAAPSCYITSLERLFATIGPQDAEQNITGQVAFGMDHADFVTMRAPKPTLLSVGTQDFFDIQGSWDTFREVKLIYGRLGHGERVDLFESDEPHGFTRPRRQSAMRWLRRWLLKLDDAPDETDFPVATDAQLQVTRTGQVLADDPESKTIFGLNADRAEALSKLRVERFAGRSAEALRAEVRKRLALPEGRVEVTMKRRDPIRRDGTIIDRRALTTEPGVTVPVRLLRSSDAVEEKPMVVYIGANPALAAPGGSIEARVKAGETVALIDPRGMGETTPGTAGTSRPGLFGPDMKEAFLGVHLNRPLLGQRVHDVLQTLRALDHGHGFHLVGIGIGGPIALHAALLDDRVKSVAIEGSVVSWSAVAHATLSRDQLSSVVPGVLESYDLPDLAAAIAPRPLTIRSPVNPSGWPLTQARVDAAYAPLKERYRELKAAEALTLQAGPPTASHTPVLRTVDLTVGETQTVELSNGKSARVKLLDVDETRDPIRNAIREAKVTVDVDGKRVVLASGNYNLPVTVAGAGVQLDCPVTGGYRENTSEDSWGLDKDARLRLWPAGAPWIEPTTFVYPARQRWFASSTQMANEPVYVDGGEKPSAKTIYYHNGLDIGGAEGMVEVVAATEGVVVSAGTALMAGFKETAARPRYDVVYILDDRGWYYRYSHLQTIDPAITPGALVRMGQKVGTLGKEGGSGGWSHLHFGIASRQPSGKWGTQEGYAFLWQAAQREQKPDVIAVARPHRLTFTDEPVTLDAAKSWSRSGPMASFEWTFTDGTTATGARVERTYERPGAYSEIVKVTDRQGRMAYDFAIVQVIDRSNPDLVPPTIHAAYSPTQGLMPGEPVTFKVRTFRTTDGHETWDFGDGTPTVEVQSDGNVDQHARDGYAVTTHSFEKPGHYLVRVDRTDTRGAVATARLVVVVGGGEKGK